jgi:tripartite-type tricarboxylate transporter receptor subunit TctC
MRVRVVKNILSGFAATCALLAAPVAPAQDWPKQRPVTFVVAFGPGAVSDILARIIGQKLGDSIGQAVVVDNRGGAGGNIAAQRAKQAAPDGYTILVTSNAFTVNPSLYANAGYDPIKDFIPVILAASTPNVITVHPSVPAKNLRELIELARKQPLAYATPGIGTTSHLATERIKSAAKIDITHVPYPPAQALNAALAGHVQVLASTVTLPLSNIKAGKLRPIAVTSAQRSPAIPDVPTVNEQGFKDFDDLTWFGFFAPVGTPAEVISRLNSEINRILEMPDIREKLGQLGLDLRHNAPAEFAAFIREEIPKWAKAVKDSGAKAD